MVVRGWWRLDMSTQREYTKLKSRLLNSRTQILIAFAMGRRRVAEGPQFLRPITKRAFAPLQFLFRNQGL